MRKIKHLRLCFSVAIMFCSGLACSVPFVGSTSEATSAPGEVGSSASIKPTATQATEQGGITSTVPVEVVNLDACSILTREEAAALLSEPVTDPRVSGGACIYADAATGVHVLSAYALQGEQAKNLFGSGRIFLLGAFGMQIDQVNMDELKALDQAGENRKILEKLVTLSQGNPAFISQVESGPWDFSYWAWKDLGAGVRQGFLMAIKGDVTAGADLVTGEAIDQVKALDIAHKVVEQAFNRIPPRFVIPQPTPTPLQTDTPIPAPTVMGGGSGSIAFESDRTGNAHIYLMNLDGSNQRQMTYSGANYSPAWSPDGASIAFYALRSQDTAGLYVMNADGSGERLLTLGAYISGSPTWSPDGSRIAFVARQGEQLEIMMINADGSNLVNLSNHPSEDYQPAWSPDGSRLAFVSDRSGWSEIHIMNADGSGILQWTSFQTSTSEPAWSPDGDRLAFVKPVPGMYGQVFVMNLDGSGLINLTNNPMDNHAPEWSPDGLHIVFYGAGYQGNWEIFIMPPDGSGQTNLTNYPAHDSFPAWQP